MTVCDVVIVPDFAGPQPHLFEIRTLFFLSFWLENIGKYSNYPLHIACIGEPPRSVIWLANQCNAVISVHPPIEAGSGQTMNKLRGLEITRLTDYLLLLDVDVFVLSDFGDLAKIDNCIAASLAIRPRVPERHWQRIFSELQLEYPAIRTASAISLLGHSIKKPDYPEQNFEAENMLPYYNTGIIYMPWAYASKLRPIWEEHIYRIRSLFDEQEDDALGGIVNSDQAGFATTVNYLEQKGISFQLLPYVFHGHWVYIQGGTMRLADAKFFHATSSFRGVGLAESSSTCSNFCGIGPMWLYKNIVLELKRVEVCFEQPALRRNILPLLIDTCKLLWTQQLLYNKYVAKGLAQNG